MTMALSYVNNFKVLPMTGEDNSPPCISNFNEYMYNTKYTSHTSQVKIALY